MRSLHHHGSQIPVSFFTDSLLWLALSGVPPARFQPQKTTYLATLQKTVWVFYGQHIRQRDLRSYTLHLLEQGHFRVHFLGDFPHPRVVFLDALVQRFDFFEQRLQNIAQLRAQFRCQLPAHLLRATLRQPFTMRLRQSSCRIHQGGSCPHQFRTCPDHCQMNLCFCATMPYRSQQRRVDSCQPCQCPRIVSIIFSFALADQFHLLRVCHEHLVSQLL